MKKTVAILIVTVAVFCALVFGAPGSPEKLLVKLEAKPSKSCLPASALQDAELKEDFSKACKECELWAGDVADCDFLIIVEDPGYSWKLSLYNHDGRIIEELNWSGPLNLGLKKAVGIMHARAGN